MKAVIFLNGEFDSDPVEAAKGADFTVCADGAYDYLRGRIVPTVILGDFDSVSERDFPFGSEILTFPPEKDFTDGHLAIASATERGADEIDVYGAFGGVRPDHAYANLSLLYLGKKRGAFVRLISRKWVVTLENGKFSTAAKRGGYVSLVPFFESSHILSTKGLKYSACDVTLYREQSLGISNEAKGDVVEVDLSGETLVFVER